MIQDKAEAAVQQLLLAQPDLQFFYKISLEYNSGSVGDSVFHTLVTEPQACQATIQRLCAEQNAKYEAEIAELQALPPEEEPYDPFLPAGCSAALCIVLTDPQPYVSIHSQRWNNQGQPLHDAVLPDIFDVAYYSDKVRQGGCHVSRA
ncbi:MAG: hypothetical protein R3E79_03535 [Caldilineaceae bacterium]